MKGIDYKITSHVRRDRNKPADFLANWGSKELRGKVDDSWTNQMMMTRWESLRKFIENDSHATIQLQSKNRGDPKWG